MTTPSPDNPRDTPAKPDQTPGDGGVGDDEFTGQDDDWTSEPGEDTSGDGSEQDNTGDADAEITSMDQAVWHAPRGPRTRIIAFVLLVFIATCVVLIAMMAILSLVQTT